MAVAAVVGGDQQFVGKGGELFFKEQQVLAARADDAHHPVARAGVALGDVVHGRDARAAAHADHSAAFFNVRGVAQRTADVRNGVAFLEGFQQGRAFAQDQIDDGDGAVGRIRIGDGQGDAFARGAHAQHDEMSRMRFLGDVRRVQDQFAGFARDQAFLV